MDTNDLLASWSSLSLDEIATRLEAGTDLQAAEQLFGQEEVGQIQDLLAEPMERGLREAVVLLPGFMGSLLDSVGGVNTLLWLSPALVLNGQIGYLELNHDGTGDATPGVEAVPIGLEILTYLKLALALRRKTDLYEFPYDWRRPIQYNGDLLHEQLERWSNGDPERQFTLVGHSMGGIVSRAYMTFHKEVAAERVRQVIMHGTPHYGAANTMPDFINGNRMMGIIQKVNPANNPRRVMLNMPSAYQLMPAPPDLFPKQPDLHPDARSYPANWDLYDSAVWQLNGLRQDYLTAARQFHELLSDTDFPVPVVEIAGCHINTIVAVERHAVSGAAPELKVIQQDEGPNSGDGTVPLWSSTLPGATMYYIQEVHSKLPANGKVIAATLDLIKGDDPDLPTMLPLPRAGVLERLLPRDGLMPEDVEAERLKDVLAAGTATAEDLSLLRFG